MSKKIFISLAAFIFLSKCSSETGKIDHAKFEIEQGNFASARRYLAAVDSTSPLFRSADSILKSIEGR